MTLMLCVPSAVPSVGAKESVYVLVPLEVNVIHEGREVPLAEPSSYLTSDALKEPVLAQPGGLEPA